MKTHFTPFSKNILRFCFTTALILTSVMQAAAETYTLTNATFYFDNTNSQWKEPYICILIGHDTYSEVYELKNIPNTKLYYKAKWTWENYANFAFINTDQLWGTEKSNNANRRDWATNCTDIVWKTFESGYYIFTPLNNQKYTSLTYAKLTNDYTALNHTQEVKITTIKNLESSAPDGLTTISYYELTADNQTTNKSTTTNTASAVRTSEITYTATDKDGYYFTGWYRNGALLSTEKTYRETVSANNTIEARYEVPIALSASANKVEIIDGCTSSVRLSINGEVPNEGEYTFSITTPKGQTITTTNPTLALEEVGNYTVYATSNGKRSNTISITTYTTQTICIQLGKGIDISYIHLHRWYNNNNTDIPETDWPGKSLTDIEYHQANGWYYIPLRRSDDKYTYEYFIFNLGKEQPQTDDLPIDDDHLSGCYILQMGGTKGLQLKEVTEGCPAEQYRIVSDCKSGKQYPSNMVSEAGEVMSMYVEKGKRVELQVLKKHIWVTQSGITFSKESGIYTYTVPEGTELAKMQLNADGFELYTGDYYLHSNLCKGQEEHWQSYTKLGEIEGGRDSARFTAFKPNEHVPNENFNHYWVNYVPAGDNKKTINVNATIGNEYNDCLSDTLRDDAFTDQFGSISENTSVRYAYHSGNNSFRRTLLGSTLNDNFLRICATHIHTKKDDNQEHTVSEEYSDTKFYDMTDWVYQVDIYTHPGSKGHINAVYNNNTQYLFGLDENGKPIDIDILPNDNNNTGCYSFRLIYDFKTNRLISTWLPGNLIVDTDISIPTNMMIVRTNNDDVDQITLHNNASISQLQQLYGVIEITKTKWEKNIKPETGGFLWFSLPFDCMLKDVFGMLGYGSKWSIQRYRGDKRAELGWFPNTPTFWANMKQNSSAMIEANRGYVLRLNLSDSDFKTVKDDNGNDISVLRLYFPSSTTGYTISSANALTTIVPEHKCEIKGREEYDSHWNVIGIPGYKNVTVQSKEGNTNTTEDTGNIITVDEDNTNNLPQFLYTWNWANGNQVYEPSDGTNCEYKTMYAYMTQFAGTITWSADANHANPELSPRRISAIKGGKMCLWLEADEQPADKTYIYLTNKATRGYDMNYDLTKLYSASVSQIATINESTDMAANCLPIESTTLPVKLQLAKEGSYTLKMEHIPPHISVILYDKQEDRRINLSFDNYTFRSKEGVFAERFELQIEVSQVSTDLTDTATDYHITAIDGKISIDGIDSPIDVRIYDVLGRLVYSNTYTTGTSIALQQGNVYVVAINGKGQRVFVP